MNSKKEIVINFPIEVIENDKVVTDREIKTEREIIDRLKRLHLLSEKNKENEWHQEYFLIYNSYILENI
ncbi:MAG: hypothetical protein A2000_05350 [Ignavibacteria bacterium GWB2_36_8]|nr:MAG: hypothetical protein A2000_05350 [Ignavibacteria bacterium GWB2_36_8]OGU49646.1 MAG: hypothetical protein A2080_01705 [Ignavibacteria bacterium GWC2_36_12]